MTQTKAQYLKNKPAPTHTERQPRETGLRTQIAAMLRAEEPNRIWNRRQRRAAAKRYIKDPITYEKHRLEEKKRREENEAKQSTLLALFKSLFRIKQEGDSK